jgi:transposase
VKTTTRVKKINGHEYLYEITYYYDKEARRTRQKSKYLGKYVDGKPVRVREKAKSPERVYSYGELIPYINAINHLGLQQILSNHLTEHEVKLFLALSLAGLTCPNAIHNLGAWYDGTALCRINPGLKVTSQTVVKLLKKLGEGSLPLEVCRSCIGELTSGEMRTYDLTLPIMNQVDDQERNEPQFNDQVLLYYDRAKNIPVAYMPHLKNMTASDLIKSSTAGMHLFNGRHVTLITGRQFKSSMNLYSLVFSGVPFILPVNAEHEIIRDELKRHRTELMHPKNLKIFRGETLFVVPITLTVESAQVHAYIIYSPRKEEEIREEYAEDLDLIIESLQHVPVYRWMNPGEAVSDIAGRYEPFIQWKVQENRMEVDLKRKALGKHLREAGLSVIISSGGEFAWDNCLEWLEERKNDEKLLMDIVQRFHVFPLSVDSEAIRHGALCIAFVSLMMERWAGNHMATSGLLNVSTPQKIMLELSKIRLIGLGNDRTIITGLTSKQQEILSTLKWQAELPA